MSFAYRFFLLVLFPLRIQNCVYLFMISTAVVNSTGRIQSSVEQSLKTLSVPYGFVVLLSLSWSWRLFALFSFVFSIRLLALDDFV